MTIRAEIEAIENGALLRAMPELGTVAVTGEERQSWLAGMLTADIASLEVGKGRYALSVNKQGRLQAEAWVVIDRERILLGLPAALADGVVAAMDRYLVMEDAEIARVEEPSRWWLLHGPAAVAAAASVAGEDVVVAAGHLGELATAIVVAPSDSATELEALLLAQPGVVRATPQGWERIRIERMLPQFGVDFDVECYPQEACLESLAVSFNKGCYLGQEAVFMLEKRGHVAKRLVRLILDGDEAPERGAAIQAEDGTRVGEVTSAIADGGKSWVIGCVRYKHTASGTELTIGERPATVSCLGIREVES